MNESLDLHTLNDYLQEHVAGFNTLERADKFDNGQSNPTYLLSAKSGQYVIRLQPHGELLKSAHAVDREYRVMLALANSDVPVPQVMHLCLDKSVLGRLFFVMQFCEGQVYWNPQVPQLDTDQTASLYAEMNRVLAALHSVDIDAVGLRASNYALDCTIPRK